MRQTLVAVGIAAGVVGVQAQAGLVSIPGQRGAAGDIGASPPRPPSYSLIFDSNRDRDWDVYVATTRGQVRALTRNGIRDRSVVSPTGRWLAVNRGNVDDTAVVLVQPATRRQLVVARGTKGEVNPVIVSATSLSRSGRLLAFVREDFVFEKFETWVATVPGRRLRRLVAGAPGDFAPDGRQLEFSTKGGIHLVDLSSRRVRTVVRDRDIVFRWWSPRWTRVAYTKETQLGRQIVVDARSGRRTTFGSDAAPRDFAWLNERTIGYKDGDSIVVAYVDTGATREIGEVGLPHWSPAGDRVAVVREGTVVVMRLDGRVESQFDIDADWLTWSPRGDRFAVVSRDRLLVVHAAGQRPPVARARAAPIYDVTWAPDGNTLAFRNPTRTGVQRIGIVGAIRGPLRFVRVGGGSVSLVGWVPAD